MSVTLLYKHLQLGFSNGTQRQQLSLSLVSVVQTGELLLEPQEPKGVKIKATK
jgi:hypothetical protein